MTSRVVGEGALGNDNNDNDDYRQATGLRRATVAAGSGDDRPCSASPRRRPDDGRTSREENEERAFVKSDHEDHEQGSVELTNKSGAVFIPLIEAAQMPGKTAVRIRFNSPAAARSTCRVWLSL
jgi:hypothetical protein